MTDKDKLFICITALKGMGKLLRDNPPPIDCGIPTGDYMNIIINGNNRDPDGIDFVNYFLNKAEKEWVESKSTH